MSAKPSRGKGVEPTGASGRPRVLMIASEVEGFARTGGLGDAVSGLSRSLAGQGADVVLVTPRYGVTEVPETASWWAEPVTVRIGWGRDDQRELGVLEVPMPVRGSGSLKVCLVDHPGLFGRAGIYGDAHGTFGDNDVRFTAMSRAALAVAERLWGLPDIIHAHDWHAAPAILSSRLTMGPLWARTKTVFTIHNLSFQGVFGPEALERLALPRASFDDGTLAHDGQLNLLRGAVALADRVTTVSPTYAREILSPPGGCGLDALLREHDHKLTGIVNGIDVEHFDPRTDGALAERYDVSSPWSGKGHCKAALLAELGLEGDGAPLFGLVSRLTEQKGVDILLRALPALGHRGARFVLVGAGDSHLEERLREATGRFPGRVASRIAFDGALARRVYAGADFLVVPSRFEPCGLTQLYAMRYGAIPVVTAVGGLSDTVAPIHALFGAGTGLVTASPDTTALLVACEDALALYQDQPSHRAAVMRAMSRDSSWEASARAYAALYDGNAGASSFRLARGVRVALPSRP